MRKEWTVTFLEYVEDTDNPIVVRAGCSQEAAELAMEGAHKRWHIPPSWEETVKVACGTELGFYEVSLESVLTYCAVECDAPEQEEDE